MRSFQRSRNLFCSKTETPFLISRSKIQDFLNCPRCFYLDRRCGTSKPPGFPFTLNTAVDKLLKAEFDEYRRDGKPHPLMIEHGIRAIPFDHPDLDDWRSNFRGVRVFHNKTNFVVTGAVDDIWINSDKELIIVDYKATSTSKEITLNEEYHQGYKNQMEVYQWLFRESGFRVSSTGYFVYCNGDSSKKSFGRSLEFSITLIPYEGDDSWIEETLLSIRGCLENDDFPKAGDSCDFCNYRAAARMHFKDQE